MCAVAASCAMVRQRAIILLLVKRSRKRRWQRRLRRNEQSIMPDPVYMDYNASVPIRPEAAAAVAGALAMGGNPSSVHRHGRAARRVIEDAREQVAAAIGARAPEIIFTSGASEANSLALLGVNTARV